MEKTFTVAEIETIARKFMVDGVGFNDGPMTYSEGVDTGTNIGLNKLIQKVKEIAESEKY